MNKTTMITSKAMQNVSFSRDKQKQTGVLQDRGKENGLRRKKNR